MRKNIFLVIGLVMLIAFASFTTSCSHKNVAKATQPEEPMASDSTIEEGAVGDQAMTQKESPDAAGTEFVDENIHFAFNSAILSGRAQKTLDSTAQYLLFNQGAKVTVEGHCDERGTEAYNMALGERRAESVKGYLVNLGISAERLDTISYGEERPIDSGKNESSWAQNRRAQLVNN